MNRHAPNSDSFLLTPLLSKITQPTVVTNQTLEVLEGNQAFWHLSTELKFKAHSNLISFCQGVSPACFYSFLEKATAPNAPLSNRTLKVKNNNIHIEFLAALNNNQKYVFCLQHINCFNQIKHCLAAVPGNYVVLSPEGQVLVANGLGRQYAHAIPPIATTNPLPPEGINKIFVPHKGMQLRLNYLPYTTPNGQPLIWVDILDQSNFQRLHHQLVQAQLQARKLLAQKETFMASIAHEVSNPLQVILGHANLLMQQTAQAHNMAPISQIKFAAQNLQYIVADLTGTNHPNDFSYNPEPVNLTNLNESLFNKLKTEIKQAGINCIIKTTNIVINGLPLLDAVRYGQIWNNLVSNAIKNTPKSGTVFLKIKLRQNEANLIITGIVADTGQGIPPEKYKLVFEAFYTENNLLNQKNSLGLGLNICKRILQRMGGHIMLKSKIGHGTAFVFEFGVPLINHQNTNANNNVTHSKTQMPNVMVVDDNPMNLYFLKDCFKQHASVQTFTTGKQALQAYKQNEFKVVFLDINLPDQNGIQIATELRKIAKQKNRIIKIIAFTGEQINRNIFVFDDWLVKPVDADVLKTTLLKHIEP